MLTFSAGGAIATTNGPKASLGPVATAGTESAFADHSEALRIKDYTLRKPRTALAPTPARVEDSLEAQIDHFLKRSGWQYGKVKANSWYINMTGTELHRIRIILGAGDTSIAVGAVVIPKRNLTISSESMFRLMKLSYDLKYVRVCIDLDDDLLVMSQLRAKWLTEQEFKDAVQSVTEAADRAYDELRPFLTAD
jgi:hypothetical protein